MQLAEALDRLPNGFPRTPLGVELAILRKIFSPEEVSLASQLSGKMETVDVIAKRVGFSVGDAEAKLTAMTKRGVLWSIECDGKRTSRLAPFVVGTYEAQVGSMDNELAHLVEDYMMKGGAAWIMGPEPALHRVVPAQKAAKSEWILPYDEVRAILLHSKTSRLADCVCRVQQDHVGRRCSFPLRTCLSFSSVEGRPTPYDISQEEALAFLLNAEEIGLVHTGSNVMKGVG